MAKCKVTVIDRKLYPEYVEKYLADPKTGYCPFFNVGDEFIFDKKSYNSMNNGQFCQEAWQCIQKYVYSAIQGGAIMKGWTNDDKVDVVCCNDGTRPVIFLIERIDED